MNLTDTFTVSAPPSEVWALFWDLPRVARCLPGCEDIQALGDGAYRAQMVQKVGPFQVTMGLDLAVKEFVETKRVVVAGGGQDRMGNRLRLDELSLDLEETKGGSEVHYTIDFSLTGRLVALGSSVVKRKAEEIRREFSKRIAAELGSE